MHAAQGAVSTTLWFTPLASAEGHGMLPNSANSYANNPLSPEAHEACKSWR